MQEKECLFGVEDKKLEKMSYSKLSTMDTSHGGCPFKYKLQYIEGHFPNTNSVATEFGTLIHFVEETMGRDILKNQGESLFMIDYQKYSNLLMNGYHKCEPIGKYTQEEADAFNQKYKLIETDEKFKTTESIKYDVENIPGAEELSKKYADDWFKEDKAGMTYADKVASYLAHGIYRLGDMLSKNPNLEIIGLEQEFNLEYGEYLFHGFIDRVLRDKSTGEIFIEDIKTYSKAVADKDLATPLQFVFYTLAAKELYHTNLIHCAYEMPLIGLKQSAGTSGFIDRGIKKINKLLSAVEAKEFAPAPTALCHWCPFSKTYPNQPEEAKNLCPYYSHWTKTNRDFSVENPWMGEENHRAILESFIQKYNRNIQQELSKDHIVVNKFIDLKNNTTERRFILRR